MCITAIFFHDVFLTPIPVLFLHDGLLNVDLIFCLFLKDTSVDISGPTVPVDLTVGRYIQSYVATDKNGNTDRCTFAVKIAGE